MVSEYPQWATGDTWTGNADANDLPVHGRGVLGVWEWQDWRVQRAEVSTILPGRPVSVTDVLRADPGLPDQWWIALRSTWIGCGRHRPAGSISLPADEMHRVHTEPGCLVDHPPQSAAVIDPCEPDGPDAA